MIETLEYFRLHPWYGVGLLVALLVFLIVVFSGIEDIVKASRRRRPEKDD